jgi:hypothetical protein
MTDARPYDVGKSAQSTPNARIWTVASWPGRAFLQCRQRDQRLKEGGKIHEKPVISARPFHPSPKATVPEVLPANKVRNHLNLGINVS